MSNKLRFVLVLGFVFMLVSAIVWTVFLLRFPYAQVERQSGVVQMECGKQSSLQLTGLQFDDRVMVRFSTKTPISLIVSKASQLIPTAPFEVEGRTQIFVDYLLESQRFLFIVPEAGDYSLLFAPLTPQTLFSIFFSDEVNASLSQSVLEGKTALNVTLSSFNQDGERFPKIFLTYPLELVVENDFEISGTVSLASGAIGLLTVNLVDDTDYSFYSFLVLPSDAKVGQTISFRIDTTSKELFGRGSIQGDKLSFLSIGIALDKLHFAFEGNKTVHASVLLGDIRMLNSGKKVVMETNASNVFQVPYQVYVSSKFHPSYYDFIIQMFLLTGVMMVGWVVFVEDRKRHASLGFTSRQVR